MVLFLDFDGCLHNSNVVMKPCSQADALNLSAEERRFVTNNNYLVTGENLFEHCNRLAVALEPFPEVRIVITSTWRKHFNLDELKGFLPPSLAVRVIGVTPEMFTIAGDGVTVRSREINRYLERNGLSDEQWIVLDDTDYLFYGYGENPHLLLLDAKQGFTDAAAILLSQRLREMQIEDAFATANRIDQNTIAQQASPVTFIEGRGLFVLLKNIPTTYREQFLADMMGQTFEMVDGEPAFFVHDWKTWVARRAFLPRFASRRRALADKKAK